MTTSASPFSNFNLSNQNFGGFGQLGSRQPFANFGPGGTGNQDIDPIFRDLLEAEPDIPFFGRLFSQDTRGRDQFTPNQQAAFRNQRQQFTDRFLAQIFEQIQRGEAPSERFTDFIGDFDFGQEFNQQFGPGTARFAPRTQFLGR